MATLQVQTQVTLEPWECMERASRDMICALLIQKESLASWFRFALNCNEPPACSVEDMRVRFERLLMVTCLRFECNVANIEVVTRNEIRAANFWTSSIYLMEERVVNSRLFGAQVSNFESCVICDLKSCNPDYRVRVKRLLHMGQMLTHQTAPQSMHIQTMKRPSGMCFQTRPITDASVDVIGNKVVLKVKMSQEQSKHLSQIMITGFSNLCTLYQCTAPPQFAFQWTMLKETMYCALCRQTSQKRKRLLQGTVTHNVNGKELLEHKRFDPASANP